jgi:Pyridoxamine 5'-phosphate oxidase
VAKAYPEINAELAHFIEAQSVFFVATAPLDANGHVNLSPKGLDTFRILGPTTIAYLDIFGSGVETIAHLRENGRIVVMFCAFQGAPKILRLHGQGRVVEPREPGFAALEAHFPVYEGTHAIMVVEITRISDSCGYGVPPPQVRSGANGTAGLVPQARDRRSEDLPAGEEPSEY